MYISMKDESWHFSLMRAIMQLCFLYCCDATTTYMTMYFMNLVDTHYVMLLSWIILLILTLSF